MSKKLTEEKNETAPETSTENLGTNVDKTFEAMEKIVNDNVEETPEESAPEAEPVVTEEPAVEEVEEKVETVETPVVTEEVIAPVVTEEPLTTPGAGIEVTDPIIEKGETEEETEEEIAAPVVDGLIDVSEPGEYMITEALVAAYPDLTGKVGDVLIVEEGKPWATKPYVDANPPQAPIEFDPENTKFARVQEIISQENNFNYLAIGQYLKEGYGLDNLKTFHGEYKKAGALSTPNHYELVALLDELFPVVEEIADSE